MSAAGALIPLLNGQGGTHLVTFEAAKRAVREAKTLPDIARIKDGMARLEALARIKDDRELHMDAAELHREAVMQFGRTSAALDKAQPTESRDTKTGRLLPNDGKKGKADALAAVGVSTSAAQRAEELAGGRTQRGQEAAMAAAQVVFERARKEKRPVTDRELRKAVRETVDAAVGPRPPRKPKPKRKRMSADAAAFADFTGAVDLLASDRLPSVGAIAATALRLVGRDGIADLVVEAEKATETLAAWLSALRREIAT
jgi:hypothetical protein